MKIWPCLIAAEILLATVAASLTFAQQPAQPSDFPPITAADVPALQNPVAQPQPAAVPSPAEIKTARVNAPTTPELRSAVAPPDEQEIKSAPAPSAKASPEPTRAPTPGEVLYNQTHDASTMYPMSWSVSIFKARHQLVVFYKGRTFRKYDAVFGRNLDNTAKAYANDRRTPEGVYVIVKKYPSRRFKWFLRLNYPNFIDRKRYIDMRAENVLPIDEQDGRIESVGGAVGIHGTDVPVLNAGHVNWTTGCVSVSNASIEDLDRMLPVGTVVIIKP